MTGYGRGEYKADGIEINVEIKTVNNRYLDVSVKSPRIFAAIEEDIRGIIREKLTRGHADVYISFTDKREKEKNLYVDESVAKAYVSAAEKIKSLFPALENDVTVSGVLRYPDVLKSEEASSADDEAVNAMKIALKEALEKLNIMREREGVKLAEDMTSRMKTIGGYVADVEKRAPLVVENYKAKLENKMRKILESIEPDEGRLLTEAALFADKSNIDEELTRLHSHIVQFGEICAERLVGRKLDFLVQEFNRETNTICSKSNDIEITRLALAMKNEIEKIREQVQNVE